MNDKDKKPGNPWTKSLLIWIGVLFALVLVFQLIDGGSRTAAGQAIPYSDFVQKVDNGSVRSVTMATGSSGSAITGKLDSGSPKALISTTCRSSPHHPEPGQPHPVAEDPSCSWALGLQAGSTGRRCFPSSATSTPT